MTEGEGGGGIRKMLRVLKAVQQLTEEERRGDVRAGLPPMM